MFIKNRFGHVFEVTEDVGKQMVRRLEGVEVFPEPESPKKEEAEVEAPKTSKKK